MSLCGHFEPGPLPFSVELVLDDHLGYTEALVRCSRCESAYLLEMVDWADGARLFRVAQPDEEATRLLLRDLSRGSCDINRAGEEVRQFTLIAQPLPELLLIDTAGRTIERRLTLDTACATRIPRAPWRELPCDGSLIRRLQEDRL